MFAPCVRPDQMIGSKLARYKSITQTNSLGCCEVTGIGAGLYIRFHFARASRHNSIALMLPYILNNNNSDDAGTTTQNECEQLVLSNKIPDYTWRNSSTCSHRLLLATRGHEFHRFKPCCFGHKGIHPSICSPHNISVTYIKQYSVQISHANKGNDCIQCVWDVYKY